MKHLVKFLFLIIGSLPLPSVGKECSRVIIGFRGLNDSFNYTAFNKYVSYKNACSRVFAYYEITSATRFINRLSNPYELYGFSAGALSIRPVLRSVNKKPLMIVTIGAYNTRDVLLDEFGVDYKNYFDLSSLGPKEFGTYIEVPHFQVEQLAVEHLINSK